MSEMDNTSNPQATGSLGGLTSWSRTEDRYGRMAHVRRHSPADEAWHAKRLGFNPDNLTPAQLARCRTEKKRYFAELRSASARALKRQKADRLRAKAALLDAEAAGHLDPGETA